MKNTYWLEEMHLGLRDGGIPLEDLEFGPIEPQDPALPFDEGLLENTPLV
jgi:hypothetical protein